MNRTCYLSLALVASLVLALGCDSMKKNNSGTSMKSDRNDPNSMRNKMNANAPARMAVAMIKPSKAATTQPANSNVTGTITFTQMGDSVTVAVNLTGLEPNSTHGIHLHEKSDMSDPALMSVGPHFNPEGHKHGGPNSPMAHAGDLGNITADANGNVNTEMTVKGITLDTGTMGVVGRTIMIHAKADDLKSDPAGNSGMRVAGGGVEAK